MIVKYKNKKINIDVKEVSEFGKVSGLMFRTKETKILLFEFKKETNLKVHSFFVLFDFLGVWINSKGRVVDCKIMKPFSVAYSPKKKFSKLVEIPVNEKNGKIISFFVGKNL